MLAETASCRLEMSSLTTETELIEVDDISLVPVNCLIAATDGVGGASPGRANVDCGDDVGDFDVSAASGC